MSYLKKFDTGDINDPTANSNWQLVEKKLCVAGTAPTGSFDVSNCSKYMIDVSVSSTPTGQTFFYVGGDTAANYRKVQAQVYGTTSNAANSDANHGILRVDTWASNMWFTATYDKNSKMCNSVQHIKGATSPVQEITTMCLWYKGSASQDTVTIGGTGSFTGVISVYKWVEQAVPAELATYELVTEYTHAGTTMDVTLPWDGETDEVLHFVITSYSGASKPAICCQPNGDTTAANYNITQMYSSGNGVNTCYGYQAAASGYLLLSNSGDGETTTGDMFLKVRGTGYLRKSSFVRTNTIGGCVGSTWWNNVASPVTSLRFFSSNLFYGNLKIYRLAKTQLITTNPNLNTVWSKYVDANTIQIQPGEIEINGAVCQVTKPTNITLSGNLQAGISEAPSTYFYLYAKRGAVRSCSFVFTTTAPLMDRYGNSVASFDLCDAAHAWFHPTLGLGYRYIGQVYNDASSNILAYDKCYPGYWEGPWTSIVYTTWANLYHGLGKIPSTLSLVLKQGLSDTTATKAKETYYTGSSTVGVWLGNNGGSGMPPMSVNSVAYYMYSWIANNTPYAATTSGGYGKLIITE